MLREPGLKSHKLWAVLELQIIEYSILDYIHTWVIISQEHFNLFQVDAATAPLPHEMELVIL